MITIAIASNFQEERSAIIDLLEKQEDFRIIGVGTDAYDTLKTAENQQPDIIIMDFNMNEINSLELSPIIKRKSPSTALIVRCSHDEYNAVAGAFKTGISGCLIKQDGLNDLVPSIRSVHYGGWYISKSAKNLMSNFFPPPGEVFSSALDISPYPFSPTEKSIFYGILHGQTDREIAKNLNIKIGSLRNCISRIKKTMGLRNRVQITIHALLTGILHIGNGYRHTKN